MATKAPGSPAARLAPAEVVRAAYAAYNRGERVLAVVAASMRGRHSGIELEQRTPHVFTVRDGQIVRAETLAA